MRPAEYFRQLVEPAFVEVLAAEPHYLIESTLLPGQPPPDAWDRILAATAREAGLTLVTRDRRLLRYAADGYLRVLEC